MKKSAKKKGYKKYFNQTAKTRILSAKRNEQGNYVNYDFNYPDDDFRKSLPILKN